MTSSWRINDQELTYVKELLGSGFPGSAGSSFVGRLEKAFTEKFGCSYAISFTNGTATLHSALVAAGVGAGDEVIVPPLTMSSTAFAVLHAQAVPVFADVDAETFLLDPQSVRERITPRTRAIMPVSLYGLPPDMDALMAIAREHHLVVIEDDAQCFLGTYKNRLAGTLGHLASFSFQNSKHMTCGEGGMVITSNPKYAEELRRFSSLGYGLVSAEPGKSKIDKKTIVHPSFKRHVSLGFNYRLSDICAAVALAQFEKLDQFVEWRRKTAAAFAAVVKNCPWLKPQKVPADCTSSYWAYAVRLAVDDTKLSWQAFYDKFVEFGGEGFYGAWSLSYLEPVFQSGRYGRYAPGLCPVAETLQPRLIQFKTNYGDQESIDRQAQALARTIRHFDAC
ncbi:MAG: DegT/DnrJ/EryC1/StrS family aminotransferase [Lentisphaeria bacterium]